VSTFGELKEQAEQDIRAHIQSTAPDSAHHFIMDETNYFVDHAAGLLAALRVWGQSRRMTDVDLQALIDLADAATLEHIADVLAHGHDPDELHASVTLEATAFASPHQLHGTLDFARKGLQPS
jgi:hypothetical protein